MSDIVERLRYFGSQMCHEAADEITRLRAQVAALEVEAGRYRYLRHISRQECLVLDGPEAGVWCDSENEHGELVLLTEGDLDAAIDAALAARKGEA